MKKLPEWSEEESQFAALLQAEPAQWTSQCYEPLAFVELARQGDAYAEARAMWAHMAGCAYCTGMYVDTVRACQAADAVREPVSAKPRTGAIPGPVSQTPVWRERLLAWFNMPHFRQGLQVGGAALAGAILLLLLQWPGMKQRQETVRKLQEELKQASRQTQAAQVTLEKEKNAHSKTRLALASASANKNPPIDLDVTRLDPLNETRLTAGDTEQAEITLLSPRGTNVGSLRPLFIWKLGKLSSETRGKIRAYKIRVVNTKNENEIIEFYVAPPLLTDNVSKDISQEILGIPPVDKQLKPATTYKWSVYALKNSKDAVNDALASSSPHQETKFGTLTEAELGQEGRMRMQHSVMEDAEQALQADSKNPASRELLTKIRNWKKNLPASHP